MYCQSAQPWGAAALGSLALRLRMPADMDECGDVDRRQMERDGASQLHSVPKSFAAQSAIAAGNGSSASSARTSR